MGLPAKLSEIMEAIEFQTEESTVYLNKEAGEIVTISEEEFQATEQKVKIKLENKLRKAR